MDCFHLFGKKRIAELEEKVKRYEEEIEMLTQERGTEPHKVGVHCVGCKHCIEDCSGLLKSRICELDILCKDREDKEKPKRI